MNDLYNAPMKRRPFVFSAIILFAIGLLLYAHTLHYGFVELDDPLLILENPAAQSLSWPHLKTVFTSYDPELYIPLTFVSYQIDGSIGGLHPFLFHLHNVLEHILNAWLIFLVLFALLRRRTVAITAALLFLVYPTNVEAVLWASGRKDLLSTTFFLLSLLFYVYHLRATNQRPYWASVGSFLLGLLSKVSVISLPLVLLIIDWIEGRTMNRRAWLEKIPFVFLAVIFGIVAIVGKSETQVASFPTHLLASAYSVVYSLGKILVPVHLSPIYAYTGPITLTALPFFGSLLVLAAATIVLVVMRHRWKAIACAAAFFVVTYAPAFGNLIKAGEYYMTTDRYAYIPAIAVFVLAALAVERVILFVCAWFPRRMETVSTVAIIAGVMLIFCPLTARYSTVWADSETLSRYIVTVSGNSWLGHQWHGNALRDTGDLDGALAEYARVLAVREDPQTYYNRGLTEELMDQPQRAADDYRHAIRLYPTYALAQINLGKLEYLAGRLDEARTLFEQAVAEQPQLAMPYYNLGVLAGEKKNAESAMEFYKKALERDPDLSDARANLAIALLTLKRTAEAVDQMKETLRRDPENATARALLEQLMKDGVVTVTK